MSIPTNEGKAGIWRILRIMMPIYLLLMAVVWATLLRDWSRAWGQPDPLGPDFMAFYTGGQLVTGGHLDRLYDIDLQWDLQRQFGGPGQQLSAYVNPPQWALVSAPLALLPYQVAFAIWSLLMVAATAFAIWLLRPLLPNLESNWTIAAALALGAAPVYFTISAGQNTGATLLLHAAILYALTRKQDTRAGILIALGFFKPQYFIVLLPLLVLARRWRAVAAALAGIAVMVAVAWAMVGGHGLVAWAEVLGSPLYRFEEQRQASKMFSWQPFWGLLLGFNTVASLLGWLSMLVTGAVLAWLWLRPTADEPLRYAATLLGIMAIGPHLPVYDLALLIIPGLVIADRFLGLAPTDRLRTALQVWLLAVYVIVFFYEQVRTTHVQIVVPLMAVGLALAFPLLTNPQPHPSTEQHATHHPKA